jgi:hypothetical protein
MLDWCRLNWHAITEAFFDDAVGREMTNPFNTTFRIQTPVEILFELQASDPPPPSGFVFHMSRCGSSLVAKMLQMPPRYRMLAEPSVVSMFLRATADLPLEQRAALLRGLACAFGRPDPDGQQPAYFLKLDAWDIFSMPLFRQAFPDTPWIFVYRDPVEVLVSQMRLASPGALVRLNLLWQLAINPAEAMAMPDEEFTALLVGKCCQTALENLDEQGHLLHYRQLPTVAFDMLPHWFGVTWTARDKALLRRTAQFHAKQSTEMFSDDSAAKQRAATPAIRAAAEHWAQAPYDRLLAAHRKRGYTPVGDL